MAYTSLNNEPSSPLSEIPESDSDVSVLSRSPTPPPGINLAFAQRRAYISPSSSRRSSAKTSPAPEDMPSPPPSNDEGPRPAKRRKLTDPKERTAEYLDLSGSDVDEDELPQLQRLLNVYRRCRHLGVRRHS
jgi:NAD-dependent histone deacetylase SIR2